MEQTLATAWPLAVALLSGLIIGLERGHERRDLPDEQRFAGLRTFGIVGLLGGTLGLIAVETGGAVAGLGMVAIAAALILGHRAQMAIDRDIGITTLLAAMLTAALGMLAGSGHPGLAGAGAVVTALLLNLKPTLHGLLRKVREEELTATLRLLLLSVVILPFLPNRGYGPYQALNPYAIWWMVVLLAGLSFLGYVAVRVLGTDRGLGVTALAGGLASSTAVTVTLARKAAGRAEMVPLAVAATLLAWLVMFVRVGVLMAAAGPEVLRATIVPLAAAAVATAACAALFWRRGVSQPQLDEPGNPLELGPAVLFALLLAAVLLAGRFLQDQFGHLGLYILALVSGMADLDAITLSASRMSAEGTIDAAVAGRAVLLAAASNTVVKTLYTVPVAGAPMASRLGVASAVILATGAVAAWIAAGWGGA